MTAKSNSETLVTVYGGSGFLGRHVVRALASRGYLIRVAVRRPDLAGHLQPLGRVGQIHAVQANLRHAPSVEAAARDAHVLINLVGLLYERGRQRFDTVHAYGAEQVALAASAHGARLVHVSAIGADEHSRAAYARSKAEAERLVLAALPQAVIMRPSIVFGPEDDFFNRFAALARISPALPLIGGGATRFQPVFVGDVAAAIADAVDGNAKGGTIYELGGPEVRTFEELMRYVLATIERKRLLVPVPFFAAKIKAALAAILAEAAAHARSGRAAADRQCRLRRRQGRRPHAARSRHRAGADRGDRAVLSVALPQDRPVPRPRGVAGSGPAHQRRAAMSYIK